jgi:hypothetical protein
MRFFNRHRPMRDHSIVLMPRQSKLMGVFKFCVLLLLVLSIPATYWYARQAGQWSQADVVQERDGLLVQREEIVRELNASRQHAQQLQVDLLVAVESGAENRGMVQELEQQLFHLQQDLAQYQGALVPNAASPGVRIQAFELQATDDPGRFRYKIMVSRVGDEEDTFKARLVMQVHGRQNGTEISLPLAELTDADDDDGILLDFRYFQVVPAGSENAEMRLPEGFEPMRVELQALQNGSTVVERTFEWTATGAKP